MNHGAFALIACSPDGLQALADDLDHRLWLCGLEISTGLDGKSASLRIDVNGSAKEWTVHPHSFITIGGEYIAGFQCHAIKNRSK